MFGMITDEELEEEKMLDDKMDGLLERVAMVDLNKKPAWSDIESIIFLLQDLGKISSRLDSRVLKKMKKVLNIVPSV